MPVSEASASCLRQRRVGLQDRRRALPAAGARITRTFGASRPRSVPVVAPVLVVDVDAVAARRRSRRGRARRRRGSRRRAACPVSCGRDRLGEAGAQVGGRDLLAGEDVRDRDAAVEVRRVGDRADLEVVLRRGVAAWKSSFSAITVPEVPFGIRFFATSTGVRRRRVVDARAVLDEVDDRAGSRRAPRPRCRGRASSRATAGPWW